MIINVCDRYMYIFRTRFVTDLNIVQLYNHRSRRCSHFGAVARGFLQNKLIVSNGLWSDHNTIFQNDGYIELQTLGLITLSLFENSFSHSRYSSAGI